MCLLETSDIECETSPKKRAKVTATVSGKNNRCPRSEKSSKDVLSDRNIPGAANGLRRSTRYRVPPLDHWRNERLVFKALPSGDVQCMGIDKGFEEDNYGLRQILRKREAREKKSQKKKVGKTVKNTSIRDVRTGRAVQMLVHRPFETLEWTVNPNEVKETPSYRIGKSFTFNTTSFGFLDISPFSSKETQVSPIKNLHFVLIKGHLEVTIQDTKFTFTVGDSWIVPMGVPYSFRNCKRAKPLMSFSTFKE
ncbi:CENP-C_C domain-containing protein [Trichonephila clavata]|uniref:CENP-C_C domain-containing protein n=1 Tax=Trichonephila clavata TaxID=2740835 RepID=A0A8X6M4J7_TRICU|nr:CENP-C_C domain-containing protein [Trichonephila clavata]